MRTDLETLMDKESAYDSKNKLNRFMEEIPESKLQQIETGVTSEDLDEMIKSGIPIFKYKGQITIHGLFPELTNGRVWGYQNIFQNQNKSIGVKYNAIDEDKRRRINERLSYIGFHYHRTSSKLMYEYYIRIESQQDIENMKSLYAKVKQDLFIGNSYLYGFSIYGIKYISIEIWMNMIYEKNIEEFLNSLGATTEYCQKIQAKRDEKYRLSQIQRDAEYLEEKEREKKVKESRKDELDKLNEYPKVKTKIPGIYIDYYVSSDKLYFSVIDLYLLKGKKKNRKSTTRYETLDEALKHEEKRSYNDVVYDGSVIGHRIRNN